MTWKGPIKPVQVKLPTDLHEEVKGAAPKRTGTVEKAYEEGMTEWLGKEPVENPESGYPRHHQNAHRMLETILADGTPTDVSGITVNLENFVEAIRSRKPPRSSKRVAGG